MTYKMEKFRLFSSSAKVERKIRSPKRKLMLYSRFGLLAAFARTLLRLAGALGGRRIRENWSVLATTQVAFVRRPFQVRSKRKGNSPHVACSLFAP